MLAEQEGERDIFRTKPYNPIAVRERKFYDFPDLVDEDPFLQGDEFPFLEEEEVQFQGGFDSP